MLLSMTGHGAATESNEQTTVSVEIRTINSRYLKLVVRCPEGYSALEPRVEDAVRACVRRGTVQVQVQIQHQSSADDFHIDQQVLRAYQEQIQQLETKPSIDTLLSLPGVVVERASNNDSTDDWELIEQVLQTAMARLQKMREQEGRAMAADLEDNRGQIGEELDLIARRLPEVAEAYSDRLVERINKLLDQHGVEIDPTNVVREVGIFAEKADVSEELVRLGCHLDQFANFVEASDSNGRKLDFLIQEMFREANTIGSKANDVEIATRVVQIKSCIERMREMIQNVQ